MMTYSKTTSQRLLISLFSVLLAACTATPPPAPIIPEKVISKYAEQKEFQSLGDSTSKYRPIILHNPLLDARAALFKDDYLAALKLLKNKRYKKAYAAFEKIRIAAPEFSGPLVNQGIILTQLKKYKASEKTLLAAIKVNPDNPLTFNLLGISYRYQGKFKQAKQAYNNALLLDNFYSKAHFNLAVLAELYLQDYHLALHHFKQYQATLVKPDKSVKRWIKDISRRLPKNTTPNTTAKKKESTTPLLNTEIRPEIQADNQTQKAHP